MTAAGLIHKKPSFSRLAFLWEVGLWQGALWQGTLWRATFYPTVLLFLALCCTACEWHPHSEGQAQKPGQAQQHSFSGSTMGTTYNIKLLDTLETGSAAKALNLDELKTLVSTVLNDVDQAMSTYKPNSELSLINQQPVGVLVSLSSDMLIVLQAAKQVHSQSGGAFDVSVGPLVDLWGFGTSFELRTQLPSTADIKKARDSVGFDAITFNIPARQLFKHKLRYLDLSAIAKGYAVDQVTQVLAAAGVTNYLVEVGGELRATGINRRAKPWTVAVEEPAMMRGEVFKVLALKNKAVATSGDYRNYYEVDGHRYSHTIDPRTGRPITHKLASVTVVHESTMLADAWATALNVLGPNKGMRLANDLELMAYFIVRTTEQGGFEGRASEAFSRYTATNESS